MSTGPSGMILEIYDAMAEAERTGVPYASPFDETTASLTR